MSEVRKGYKMTELGVVPSEWQLFDFDSVFELIDGDRSKKYPSPNEIVDSGILFLSTANIKNQKLNLDEIKFITQEKFDSLSKGKLVYNDLIITLRGTLGSIALFNDERFQTGFINAQMMILRSLKDINPEFAYYYLTSELTKQQINLATSGSAQPQLTKKELKLFKIVLPTLAEQQKVAQILSTVDEQIDETEQLIVKTKELKKGLMQQLLTKGIGHTEFKQTELGKIPVEWEIKCLGDFIHEFKGGASITPTDFSDEGIKVIPKKIVEDYSKSTIANLSRVSFASLKKFNKSIINSKYLITSLRDLVPTAPSLGKIVKIPLENNEEFLLAQGVYGFMLKPNVNEQYVMHVSHSDSYRKKIQELKVGSTQVHMRQGDFWELKIAFPSLEEQQKIAKILSTVDEQIEVYEQEKAKYEELKKGLMQQLLTGQIRVKM